MGGEIVKSIRKVIEEEQADYLERRLTARLSDLAIGTRYHKAWTLRLTEQELCAAYVENHKESVIIQNILDKLKKP
jgi:hypothetical protein